MHPPIFPLFNKISLLGKPTYLHVAGRRLYVKYIMAVSLISSGSLSTQMIRG
jgi:hypothetical protein